MQEPILSRDADLHVNDFDAATDVLQISSEQECHNPPHWGAMPTNEMEFTTEWQMEAAHAAS
jgi:hypothetical protein